MLLKIDEEWAEADLLGRDPYLRGTPASKPTSSISEDALHLLQISTS